MDGRRTQLRGFPRQRMGRVLDRSAAHRRLQTDSQFCGQPHQHHHRYSLQRRQSDTLLGKPATNYKAPHAWTAEITRYIKSLDSNHLIMDGFHAINDLPIREKSLLEPSIDIVSSHHYETDPLEMLQNIQRKVDEVDGRKPYVLGEIGFISTSGMASLLDSVITDTRLAGALTWSLRYHHRNGGFYWHSEPVGLGLYKAYHWPGFPSGEAYDEREFSAHVAG